MLSKKIISRMLCAVILGVIIVVPYVLGNRQCRYAYKWCIEFFYPRLSFTEKNMPDFVIRNYLDEYLSKISSYQFAKLSDVKITVFRWRGCYRFLSSFIIPDELRTEMLIKMNPVEKVYYGTNHVHNKTKQNNDISNALLISPERGGEYSSDIFFGIESDVLSQYDWWVIRQLTNMDIRIDHIYEKNNQREKNCYFAAFILPNTNRIWCYGEGMKRSLRPDE